jgi:acyl-CoA synthetase (AMP-forming)/AMP-acid ligase II
MSNNSYSAPYMTQGLHRAVQQCPQQIAAICGAKKQNYIELIDSISRLANGFQSIGMEPGDRIAIMSLNSIEYVQTMFATFWGGGVINPVNIRWSATEVAYSLDDSESTILLVDDTFAPMVAELKTKTNIVKTVVYIGEGEPPEGMFRFSDLAKAEPIVDVMRRGDDLAAIMYTGGTTGFPKGVMLSHANFFASAVGCVCENVFERGGRFMVASPLFHIAASGSLLAQSLVAGTFIIVPAFRPDWVAKAIEEEKVTHTLLVPTMIQMMADFPELDKFDLSSIKTIAYGASPMPAAVLSRAMEKFSNCSFIQVYGMTELSPIISILPAYYHTEAGQAENKLRSAGRAVASVEVRIVDEAGIDVATGTVGEIAARGAGVMQGYWRREEETAKNMLPNGWFKTGDGAYMDEEGFIYVVDRMKDMIISGGENIFSAEVENALSQHPDIAANAVIGIPSDQWGESVHAVVIAKEGAKIVAEEVIAFCKERIAGFKCPRSIEVVAALPLSGAGKVLKTELRKPYWADNDKSIS